jgi:hypothetical protein
MFPRFRGAHSTAWLFQLYPQLDIRLILLACTYVRVL